jgi:5-(carboxyamino)imidazole ribonucleotide synthase
MSSSDTMIGVVGGGQLARMLVQAASARSIPIAVQTISASDPAAEAAARIVEADPRDVAGTRELVEGCEGITFENEWVNIDALIPLEQQGVRFRPSLASLAPLVDKLSQRKLLDDLSDTQSTLVSLKPDFSSATISASGMEFSGDGESGPRWIRRKGNDCSEKY